MDNRWALILLVLLVFSMIRARPARWPAHIPDHIANMEKRFVDG